jgi:hypothetical protein
MAPVTSFVAISNFDLKRAKGLAHVFGTPYFDPLPSAQRGHTCCYKADGRLTARSLRRGTDGHSRWTSDRRKGLGPRLSSQHRRDNKKAKNCKCLSGWL